MKSKKVPTLEEAKEYIYSIDFSNIINKMIKHQGWLRKDAEKVCQMYRNFLFLKKKYKGKYEIPPSDEIDIFWHNHILDTTKYQNDCMVIFGSYLNHYPYFGIDEKTNMSALTKAFAKTSELYKTEFDENLKRVRGVFSYILSLVKKFIN